MNDSLMECFTKEEFELALHQMTPLKSPSLDGFNPSFYQMYWHIVGDKVTSVVINFLNDGIFDHDFNFTYIALIPKVTNPTNTSNFRPMSLCNVIYKLASKVLANKLKLILLHLIFKNQSTFLSGHLITNNIIVAYKALHSMKTR